MLTAQGAPRRARQQQQQRPRPDPSTAQAAYSQQLGSARNITALYNAVISATIERCTQFQSPKVMDAIEKASTAKTRPSSTSAPASTGSFTASVSSPVGKGGGNFRGAEGPENQVSVGPGKAADTAGSDERKHKLKEDKMSPEGGQGGIHPSSGRGDAVGESGRGGTKQEGGQGVPSDSAPKEQTEKADNTQQAGGGGDDDDDFADADVDEADASPTSTNNQTTLDDSQKEASQDHVQKHEKQGNSSGGAVRFQRKEDDELEDYIATWNHQGKLSSLTTHRTAAGQEIGFDRLYGELKF
ncbi:hypothetical protein CSUI_002197 [Cystoisospora suis]|uniref:Uncharacterized protein n=1 Tax=Cystoisospora suis TaxID=483139 RepID=A0A2C6LA54_9APIC|nr:hypothetical protein CSUI_002197 [Cystoisospora suis]